MYQISHFVTLRGYKEVVDITQHILIYLMHKLQILNQNNSKDNPSLIFLSYYQIPNLSFKHTPWGYCFFKLVFYCFEWLVDVLDSWVMFFFLVKRCWMHNKGCSIEEGCGINKGWVIKKRWGINKGSGINKGWGSYQ